MRRRPSESTSVSTRARHEAGGASLSGLESHSADAAQAIEILYLLLPSSRYYDLLSTLPEPQPTQPEGSSIYEIQQMTHNSMPILLEIVASTETEEAKQIKSEIDRRRMRLTSGSAEETKQAVQREVMGKSKLPGACAHPR